MTTKENFLRMMKMHTEIALATSTYSQPNVRIVHFYYDEEERVLYFSGFENKDKIREFEINPKVAFTTIPPKRDGREHVKAKGFVRKSRKTIYEVADHFTQKIPEYKELINDIGGNLSLFEITFESATVTLDFNRIFVLQKESLNQR